jgi:hypothetical protein
MHVNSCVCLSVFWENPKYLGEQFILFYQLGIKAKIYHSMQESRWAIYFILPTKYLGSISIYSINHTDPSG